MSATVEAISSVSGIQFFGRNSQSWKVSATVEATSAVSGIQFFSGTAREQQLWRGALARATR